MANVLQRTTLELRFSVNTPDYDSSIWIINPDLSNVVGVPKRYWKIVGNTISEMNQSEKDAVDSALLPSIKAQKKSSLRTVAERLIFNQGYTDNIQRSFLSQYSKDKDRKAKKAQYLEEWNDWVEKVEEEIKLKQSEVDDQTSITAVNAINIDSSTLIGLDPQITIEGALDTSDSTDIISFVDENVEVTDPLTNVVGPFGLMQTLINRREIFNDSSNPLYVADRTAILGENGYLVDHANRINNIEIIHGKLGWHRQDVKQARYSRPTELLIYYGWLNSFNSAQNGWDNEKVAQDMAKYRLLVFGDGIQDSGHGDYANTQIIIPRVKALNNYSEIYGYVTVNQDYGDFTGKVDEWDTLEVDGIFMDEAGYDFGRTRAEFNQRVDYVHSKTYANTVFANSWNSNHILGTENDLNFPNSTYNDSRAESNLNNDDWVLLESFPVNTSTGGYESAGDWAVRGSRALNLRNTYGTNFAASSVINNDNTDGTALFNYSYISSLMFSLEAHGTSDTNYGASSASVKYWTRPGISDIGEIYCLNCSVQADNNDSSVYHRYVEGAKLTLDFNDSSQTSSIIKF
jgi:hypothetical protein